MAAWLHIIGIGDDGLDGLHPTACAALKQAEIIIGGARQLALVPATDAVRVQWPSPFSALLDQVRAYAGQNVAVLVSGDPLWYSAGEKFAAAFGMDQMRVYPHVGAFQMAAAHLHWPIQNCTTLSLHGRPSENLIKYLAPGRRILALTGGAQTVAQVCDILCARGYDNSQITALSHLGGVKQAQVTARAMDDWSLAVPSLTTLGIECVADADAAHYARGAALPDDAFTHDGKMTKQAVRAISMAKLCPQPAQRLWDIGCGCGSIAIEWLRMLDNGHAIGIEPNAARRAMAIKNAQQLGTPELDLIDGIAPAALVDLPPPDAIFIGGGLSTALFDLCWGALRPRGRLVANAVTLESEAILLALYAQYGGSLDRIQCAHAEGIGTMTGWRPAMAVTQWSVSKP